MKMVLRGTDKIVDVYDVAYDSSGFPHFLIYENGQWVRRSAKHFRPPESKDFAKMLEGVYSLSLSPQKEVEPDVHYIG